jgi:phage terminase large subunit
MSAVLERPVIEVVVPYCPRNWARPFHASFKRWLVMVLHRRAGKTTSILNHHQRAALDNQWEARRLRTLLPSISDSQLKDLLAERTYWHVMPTFHQAKLTGAWATLKRIALCIPGAKPNESEMLMTYPNGNKVQLIGADKPDRLRGPGLSGLSLDEYSQIPSNAFGEVLSKSLADHLGYCIFSGTIKGTDQLYDTYQAGKGSPDWFALWQDVDVSLATEEGATITALRQAMEDDRKLVLQGIMAQAEFDQEWYLSPEAAIKGAFYMEHMKKLRENGHITRVPYDPSMPVDTDWDLGLDAMAIWFSQTTRSGEIRFIDYHEDIGGGIEEAIKVVKGQSGDAKFAERDRRRAGYIYGQHWGPHDIETREISSGTTRRQLAFSHGLKFEVTPKIALADGITAVQAMLPLCFFDETHTARGLDCLRQYKRTYQQKFNQFSSTPVHDWASHGADSCRGHAVRRLIPQSEQRETPPDDHSDTDAWMSL